MTEPPPSVPWYDAHAAALAPAYEALAPEALHVWFSDLLPPAPALVLDVGAGTGRDAAWLAGRGHDVVACEPSSAMRAEAARRHDTTSVRWVADSLPGLPAPTTSAAAAPTSATQVDYPGYAPTGGAPVASGRGSRPLGIAGVVVLLLLGAALVVTRRRAARPRR